MTPRYTFDFVAGSVDSKITFSRALNTATYVDSSGAVAVANADIARITHDPVTLICRGLLIEESRINGIRNNTMVGVVAGTPGTAPTNWQVTSTSNGVTRQIVGSGTENGVEYIDVRYYGTPTSSALFQIIFEANNQIAAANGQSWTTSAYLKLSAGSLTNVTGLVFSTAGRDASGNGVAGQTFTSSALTPTTANLATQRYSHSLTFSSASVAFARPSLQFNTTINNAIDFTLRIGLPQTEQGAFVSSVIKTSTTAVTRNADVATITGTNFSSWWIASQGGVTANFRPSTVTGTRPIIQYDDGTANEIITLRGNTTNPELYIVDGGTPQAQIDAGTIAANTDYSLTGWWATNDCKAKLGSGAIVTDTTATIPTVTQARIGSDGTNYLNGTIASLNYYGSFTGQIYTRRKNKVIFSLM